MSFTIAQSTSRPLRQNRDFVIAVAARTTSLFGDFAALVALTLRTSAQGPWAVSALLIAGFLPIVAMTPVAGLLVDRIDSRTLLVTAGLAQFTVCITLARVHSLTTVLALVFLLGCGDAVVGATWSALLPAIVGRDRLGAAIGIRQAIATAATIGAPALGGLLTGVGGAGLVLNLDAVSFLAICGSALLVRHRRRASSAPGQDGWRAGFTVISGDPLLSRLIGALFAFCLAAGLANVVSVFLIRTTLHAGAAWYGLEGAVCAAAMTAGALLSGRVGGVRSLVRLGLVGMTGLSIALVGYSVAPSVLWLMIPAAGCGLANAALNVSVGTLMMLRTPADVRGRVSAAISGAVSAAMIGSMLLGGILAATLSPRAIFALAGLVTLLIPACLGRPLMRATRGASHPLPHRDNANRASDKTGARRWWDSPPDGSPQVRVDPYRSGVAGNRPPTVTQFRYRTR